MYNFEISDKFLSEEEQGIFGEYLSSRDLDGSIWEVFSCLFRSGVKSTQPLLLRVYKGAELVGAIIITRCSGYGKALFDNRLLSGFMNLLKIPYYQWIKFGCCMDMMSNPGFFKSVEDSDEVCRAALDHMRRHSLLTIVTDYTENAGLYENASILPALPHAVIDCSGMTSVQDYLKQHRNLKRKLRVFRIKGGEYARTDRRLDGEQLAQVKRCFLSTAEKSVFYLPYQDLYLNAALTTSGSDIKNACYFIATLDGEFIGYQAALKTGKYLNALHGAFDRNLRTTHHAYDILFLKMTEFAIEEGLQVCDFGAVLNYTKQKMVNKTIEMSYFLLSRYSVIRRLFNQILKSTKIQGHDQLKFRDPE